MRLGDAVAVVLSVSIFFFGDYLPIWVFKAALCLGIPYLVWISREHEYFQALAKELKAQRPAS